jgi:uncharacterized protein with FMN-binding domain
VKIVLIIAGVIFLLALFSFVFGSLGLSDIKKMVINDVDLSKLSDGVYVGKFHKIRWTYEVEVTVKDHKITAIKNIRKTPNPSNDNIVDGAIKAMLAKQSVDIDVISGATVNTKAFQKAVENALTQGKK